MAKSAQIAHPNGSLYCSLMEFIKWRIETVGATIDLVKAKKHYLDNRTAAEFCLLQLRFCCELLAVGCVAIHTDVPQAGRLHAMWNAEAIMKAFGKLKPRFFPNPIVETLSSDGVWQHETRKGALSRDEFIRMYNLFGGLLHTGSFKGYKNPKVRSYDFKMLEDFVDRLVKLLNSHTYTLHGDDKLIRVIMKNEKDGKVWMNELDMVPATRNPLE